MRIAIVVPCTASKHEPAGDLRLGLVAGGETSIDGRFDRWQAAISFAGTVVDARGLYAGPRWNASLRIAEAAHGAGRKVELFVASAGLGLVPATQAVPSYSATFSRGNADSVVPAGLSASEHRAAARGWWRLLTQLRWSFERLARDYERVVVVLSPDYLDAVSDDLVAAVESDASRIIVFATGSPTHPSLRPVWVRVGRHLRETTEARPVPLINGLDATLLQSTAALIVGKRLSAWSSAAQVQRFLDEHADPDEVTIEARARANRRPSKDEEVRSFVRRRLGRAHESAVDLLKVWRNVEMRQCEEGRFRRLYAEVVEELITHG
jgi:hypothetical protein